MASISSFQVFRRLYLFRILVIMTNKERWDLFIAELRAYIEEHHLGPSKHTSLYNQCRYFRKKLKEGALDIEMARELEEVLSMRDLTIHTGGRKSSLVSPV